MVDLVWMVMRMRVCLGIKSFLPHLAHHWSTTVTSSRYLVALLNVHWLYTILGFTLYCTLHCTTLYATSFNNLTLQCAIYILPLHSNTVTSPV